MTALELWPDKVPDTLNKKAAENAFRRLYRFSLGETFNGNITFVSGNRYTQYFGINWRLNITKGWIVFTHELAWMFWHKANSKRDAAQIAKETSLVTSDGDKELAAQVYNAVLKSRRTKADKAHFAKFHAKLVREVVKRGWLNPPEVVGMPTPKPPKLEPTDYDRKYKRLKNRLHKWVKARKHAERMADAAVAELWQHMEKGRTQ